MKIYCEDIFTCDEETKFDWCFTEVDSTVAMLSVRCRRLPKAFNIKEFEMLMQKSMMRKIKK